MGRRPATALSDRQVLFTVDVEKAAPQLDDAWEDVVEVSFVPDTDVALTEMMGCGVWPIPLTQGMSYRGRYCALGMDAAHENQHEERAEGELVGDRYLLSFWPAPPEPDAIVKQTSEFAAYWHGIGSSASASEVSTSACIPTG